MMHTLLFDIDGTLVSTSAGMHAIGLALTETFELARIPELKVHGRTDHSIWTELFAKIQVDFDQHFPRLSQRYLEVLPDSLSLLPGRVLPGVHELLEALRQRDDVKLGLLTGNAERAAEIKLKKFDLHHYFEFGGYGDWHSCRNEVAKMAVNAAAAHFGSVFDASKVWVIGDTIHDVTCGRAIGSKVIAVETGGSSREDLRRFEPDYQFESFERELQAVLGLFD